MMGLIQWFNSCLILRFASSADSRAWGFASLFGVAAVFLDSKLIFSGALL